MSNPNANRNRLIEIVKARSFSTGAETRLVSGRSSNFYFGLMQQTHQVNEISRLAESSAAQRIYR